MPAHCCCFNETKRRENNNKNAICSSSWRMDCSFAWAFGATENSLTETRKGSAKERRQTSTREKEESLLGCCSQRKSGCGFSLVSRADFVWPRKGSFGLPQIKSESRIVLDQKGRWKEGTQRENSLPSELWRPPIIVSPNNEREWLVASEQWANNREREREREKSNLKRKKATAIPACSKIAAELLDSWEEKFDQNRWMLFVCKDRTHKKGSEMRKEEAFLRPPANKQQHRVRKQQQFDCCCWFLALVSRTIAREQNSNWILSFLFLVSRSLSND